MVKQTTKNSAHTSAEDEVTCYVNTVCGQKLEFLMLNVLVYEVTIRLWRVKCFICLTTNSFLLYSFL